MGRKLPGRAAEAAGGIYQGIVVLPPKGEDSMEAEDHNTAFKRRR